MAAANINTNVIANKKTQEDAKYFLLNDSAEISVESREELEVFLDLFDKDEWFKDTCVRSLSAVGIDKNPIMHSLMGGEYPVTAYIGGYKTKLSEPLKVQDPENESCIRETGIFLVMPYHGKTKVIPIREFAYFGLTERAGYACNTILRTEPKGKYKCLSAEVRGERIAEGLNLCDGVCTVLKRGCKISAVHGADYVVLPIRDCVEEFERTLKYDHPDLELASARISHEYFVGEWYLNDPLMEDSFKELLRDAGYKFSKIRCGALLTTSDTGNAAVRMSMFYDMDDVRMFMGATALMKHSRRQNASIQKLPVIADTLGTLLKDREDLIEELGNMDVSHIGNVIREIGEKYTGINKQIAEEVAIAYDTDFPNGGTGIDCYMAVNEIIQRMNETSKTVSSYVNNCELCEKLMKLPFDKMGLS